MADLKTNRKPAIGPTTMQVWADHIPMADAITLYYINKAGRVMTRTEAINNLIAREYAAIQLRIQPAGEH
ncbi:hypothetical protein D3C77_243820 [compost metagenome]